jgi:ferredoxin-NADP reductase
MHIPVIFAKLSSMSFTQFVIAAKKQVTDDIFILQLKPKDGNSLNFLPGQYVQMKNPRFSNPDEEHPFSIASSPTTKNYLEFCIRVYGDWTEQLMREDIGNILSLSDPIGEFTWDDSITNAVFLVGGIGISPIMSMLRFIHATNQHPKITLLYGNRTPESVMYKTEIEDLFPNYPTWKLVHIYSHLPVGFEWDGYRGFINPEIMAQEINFTPKPIYFLIGPPVFIELMKKHLHTFGVEAKNIREEKV